MSTDSEQPASKPTGSYGKRPLWHWLALYIVLGAVVYLVIYWLVLRHSSPYTY